MHACMYACLDVRSYRINGCGQVVIALQKINDHLVVPCSDGQMNRQRGVGICIRQERQREIETER